MLESPKDLSYDKWHNIYLTCFEILGKERKNIQVVPNSPKDWSDNE